ncbi:hypothetical protein OROHE_025736 [Orobanche hederae]
MFSILCRRRLRVPRKDGIFVGQQFWAPLNAGLVKSFSSQKSPPGVCRNDSKEICTVSYLINSCGLSSEDAVSASKNLCFRSPEKADAVLKLLREYGFADAHITRLVIELPNVLLSCPNKTLMPKLEFFGSIGVPNAILAHKLSAYPYVLRCSLKNSIIPTYDVLKSLLQTNERVACVFQRAPRVFGGCLPRDISSTISFLKKRGVPDSSIVKLFMYHPSLLLMSNAKLAVYVDRAVAMGFDVSKSAFVSAIRVFGGMTESTLKHKMGVYRKCGWSESDIIAAFLRHPLCMSISEKKIVATMDFLVNELGFRPAYVARYPMFLNYNLEKRIKPRCLIVRILNEKGLKNMNSSVTSLFVMSDEKFLKRFIVRYQKEVPGLLGIYQGKKSSPPDMCLSPSCI